MVCIDRERSIMSCLQPALLMINVPIKKYAESGSFYKCPTVCDGVCACTCHMHSDCKQQVASGPSLSCVPTAAVNSQSRLHRTRCLITSVPSFTVVTATDVTLAQFS